MSLIMYDSIDVSAIPPNAAAVAGYCDGAWITILELKAKFPHAHILSIAVFPEDDADCLDVETGDATPAQAPAWVRRQQARGMYRPVVYANASTMPAVLAALNAAGISRAEVRTWSAHYTKIAHICGPSTCAYPGVPDCDGTQFNDRALGLDLDESLLLSTFFGPPPAPHPHVRKAALLSGDPMFYLAFDAAGLAPLSIPPGATDIQISSTGPAGLEFEFANAGFEQPVAIDYHRGELLVPTGGAKWGKVRRLDAGANLIAGVFLP